MVEIRKNAPENHPYVSMTEEEILEKLELSRKYAEYGQYRSADDVVSDMRERYGL